MVLAFLAALVMTHAQAAQDLGTPAAILPKMHTLNTLEIKDGNLGLTKACDSGVKEFAQHLVTDHTANLAEVEALAAQLGVVVTNVVFTKSEQKAIDQHKAQMDMIATLTTCDFDEMYIEEMIEAHEFAIKTVRRAQQVATDAGVKAYLDKTLPALEAHLQMAEDLDDRID